MRKHSITKYDAGQLLICCFDVLHEAEDELLEKYPALAKTIHAARMNIGERFNKFRSHPFSLPDHRHCDCHRCAKKKKGTRV